MAFMFGPFMTGTMTGAKGAMDLYNTYQDASTTRDLRDRMKEQHDKTGGGAVGVGAAAPPQAGMDVTREGGTNTLGTAQSDSAASAPPSTYKPIDISDMPDPRLKKTAMMSEVLSGNHGQAPSPAAPPQATPQATPQADYKVDDNYSAPQNTPAPQYGPPAPGRYDVPGKPAMSAVRNGVGAIGDWLHGRTAPPVYIPGQNTLPQGPPPPQQGQAAQTGPAYPRISGQPAAAAPSLGQTASLGQRIISSFGDMTQQGAPY